LWANKLRTVVRVQWSAWPIVPGIAKLKINVAQGKFISELAIILVKQGRAKQWQQYK